MTDRAAAERLRLARIARDRARAKLARWSRVEALAHRLRSSATEGGPAHRLAWGVLGGLPVRVELARAALDAAEVELTYALAEYRGLDIGERRT